MVLLLHQAAQVQFRLQPVAGGELRTHGVVVASQDSVS